MAKKREQKDMAQEQEQRLNFQQKLIEILELGKKKKNMLEYQEIADTIGMSIRTVGRNLKKLKEMREIKILYKKIYITEDQYELLKKQMGCLY